MKNKEIKDFWINKENEKKSKLVIATVADYLEGYDNLKGPISGLLYFMENGVYFENFDSKNWFNALLGVKDNFKKVDFDILKSNIIDVCDCDGKKKKSELSLKDRILRFFNITPRVILVNFLDNNQKKTIQFKCIEEPLKICEIFFLNYASSYSIK